MPKSVPKVPCCTKKPGNIKKAVSDAKAQKGRIKKGGKKQVRGVKAAHVKPAHVKPARVKPCNCGAR